MICANFGKNRTNSLEGVRKSKNVKMHIFFFFLNAFSYFLASLICAEIPHISVSPAFWSKGHLSALTWIMSRIRH